MNPIYHNRSRGKERRSAKLSVSQRLFFGLLHLSVLATNSVSLAAHATYISEETTVFTHPNRFLYNSYGDDDTYSSLTSYAEIDWTSYALKYVSCANIKTWRPNSQTNNDDANSGDDAEDVLSQRTLVVVRLCPANACSSYNVHGCNRDYGEYVMPASDYLRIIHTYYINSANIENYCAVCTACMSYVTQTPTVSPTSTDQDDYYSNRFLSGGNDDYFNDDAYGSGSYKSKPWYLDSDGQCMYQSVCSNYMSKCKKYVSNNNNDDAYGTSNSDNAASSPNTVTNTTFGQCLAFRDDASDYYYYAAPHCAADGRTLHVGLYADADCTSYVKTTGSSNPFASYTAGLSCLSCNYFRTSESAYALISDSEMQSNSTSKNHPLCSNLYNVSARCNARLLNASKNQNDDLVCPYIESLEDNMYDAYGDVVLLKSSMYGLFGPFWRKGTGVASEDAAATSSTKHRTVELVLLFLSMCVASSLSIHAYTLRRKLLSRKFISWQSSSYLPSNSLAEGGSTEDGRVLERTDSGIGVTRSGSYEAPVPSNVYKPYGGAIPRRNDVTNSSSGEDYIDRSTGRFA